MDNSCNCNEGWYIRKVKNPYYDEEQYICPKCHKIKKIQKNNNSISSYLATQNPTEPILIGTDVYELSSNAKEILKKYEESFSLIMQVTEMLPENQNNSSILTHLYNLQNETLEKLRTVECYCPLKNKEKINSSIVKQLNDLKLVFEYLSSTICSSEATKDSVTIKTLNELITSCNNLIQNKTDLSDEEIFNIMIGMFDKLSVLCPDDPSLLETLNILKLVSTMNNNPTIDSQSRR